MAAYTAGFMTSHMWADCLVTGISSGPNARIEYGTAFTFTFSPLPCLSASVSL